jgi:hypothetical protein
VNAATAHAKTRAAASKRAANADPFVIASMRVDTTKEIFFVDDLRHRWERIVLGDRA